MSRHDKYNQKNNTVQSELEVEHQKLSMNESDYEASKNLRLNDSDAESVENEISAANKKGTGFETSYAKQYKVSPYKTNFANPFEMEMKDPARAYKQIDFNMFRKNGYRDARGWIPLTAQNTTKENFPSPDTEYGVQIQSDGFWHVGDRIWAWMPRSQYAQVRQMVRLKTDARTRKINESFKKEGQSLGGKNPAYIEQEVMGPA